MGVGAIFISTFAVIRLEESDTTGEANKGLLIQTLQPIVAFVVLCSIIVRSYLILL